VPHTFAIGSSRKGENSYSHYHDDDIGVAVIDRFTSYTLDYMSQHHEHQYQNQTFQDLFQAYVPHLLLSQPEYRDDMLGRPLDTVKLTDMFGAISTVHLSNQYYNIQPQYNEKYIEEIRYNALHMKDIVDKIVSSFDSKQHMESSASLIESIDTILQDVQLKLTTSLSFLPYIRNGSAITWLMVLFIGSISLDYIASISKEQHRRVKLKTL
jgi:glycosylphosphatidylinositol transamidase (GPIT) subunit GPI8